MNERKTLAVYGTFPIGEVGFVSRRGGRLSISKNPGNKNLSGAQAVRGWLGTTDNVSEAMIGIGRVVRQTKPYIDYTDLDRNGLPPERKFDGCCVVILEGDQEQAALAELGFKPARRDGEIEPKRQR